MGHQVMKLTKMNQRSNYRLPPFLYIRLPCHASKLRHVPILRVGAIPSTHAAECCVRHVIIYSCWSIGIDNHVTNSALGRVSTVNSR